MNFQARFFLILGLLLAVLLVPSAASAQQTITCESNNGNRKHCGDANPGRVSLQRQISGASCTEGESWGVDDQGLWVDRGCRGVFVVGGRYYNNGENNSDTVTCESNDGQRKYCGNANPNEVSLQRQLSGASCTQGRSWGVDNQGLWVDRGCRAVFTVGEWGNEGNYGGGNHNGDSNDSVTCESNNGSRKYCGNVNTRQVSLQRQLSGSPCVQGQSWGVDNQGLWVDRGCRAVFSIGRGDWNNDQSYGHGGGSGISDYPRVSADTSGRGNFSSQNLGNANITRGWVDTRSGQPSVSLSGSGGFKITFYGVITQADGRHMTMRINRSSRGNAYGQADVYLNGDKNEIESITVNGNHFNGTFSR